MADAEVAVADEQDQETMTAWAREHYVQLREQSNFNVGMFHPSIQEEFQKIESDIVRAQRVQSTVEEVNKVARMIGSYKNRFGGKELMTEEQGRTIDSACEAMEESVRHLNLFLEGIKNAAGEEGNDADDAVVGDDDDEDD